MSIETILSYKNKHNLESSIIGFSQLQKELTEKISIMSLNQKFGHAHGFNKWLHDIYNECIAQEKYSQAADYCQSVLDTFKDDRYICDFYCYRAVALSYTNMDEALSYIQDILKKYPNEISIIHQYIRLLEKSQSTNLVEEIKKYVPLSLEHNVETEPLIKDVTRILKDKDLDLSRSYQRMQRAQDEFGKRKPQTKQVTVGRNDPCPCGSGKKYKKCCGK